MVVPSPNPSAHLSELGGGIRCNAASFLIWLIVTYRLRNLGTSVSGPVLCGLVGQGGVPAELDPGKHRRLNAKG